MKAIAFYLPQYHPIPENDEWWGKGFTEWTNVTKARPLFSGHYQPHLPADLGFYDLRVPEVMDQQAEMARTHGIHGFCFYHYWFNGKRLLERPVNDLLRRGTPNFPFCVCWANENWTRAWDGGERQVLMAQQYGAESDRQFIRDLGQTLSDPRYIRVDGKPLLLVYKASSIPDPRNTTDLWRDEASRLGIGELYLARVEGSDADRGDPSSLGFDCGVDFQPNWRALFAAKRRISWIEWKMRRLGLIKNSYPPELSVASYRDVVAAALKRESPAYPWFEGVAPSWDNTARRGKHGVILVDNSPDQYEAWLREVVTRTAKRGGEQMIFINAWNEWAEGCHLEPCAKMGTSYLEATARALTPRVGA